MFEKDNLYAYYRNNRTLKLLPSFEMTSYPSLFVNDHIMLQNSSHSGHVCHHRVKILPSVHSKMTFSFPHYFLNGLSPQRTCWNEIAACTSCFNFTWNFQNHIQFDLTLFQLGPHGGECSERFNHVDWDLNKLWHRIRVLSDVNIIHKVDVELYAFSFTLGTDTGIFLQWLLKYLEKAPIQSQKTQGFLRCRFCDNIWRKKVVFENFSTV